MRLLKFSVWTLFTLLVIILIYSLWSTDSTDRSSIPGIYVHQLRISDTLKVFKDSTFFMTEIKNDNKIIKSGYWSFENQGQWIDFHIISDKRGSIWPAKIKSTDEEIIIITNSDLEKGYFKKIN